MAYIDPVLMGTFRSRVLRNPLLLRRVYNVCRSYSYQSLKQPTGAYSMVDRLSCEMGVPVTVQQRANAANWLMQCNVDPHNPRHRQSMWRLIRGK